MESWLESWRAAQTVRLAAKLMRRARKRLRQNPFGLAALDCLRSEAKLVVVVVAGEMTEFAKCTMQRNAVLCSSMQRNAAQCNSMQRNAAQCNSMQRNAAQRRTAMADNQFCPCSKTGGQSAGINRRQVVAD